MTRTTQAWVIRSGRYGERDAWAMENGWSGGGWGEIPDLTEATSRLDIEEIVTRVLGTESPAHVAGSTGQMYALRYRMEVGDIVVMPRKTAKDLAFGRITSTYRYLSDEPDPNCRHVVGVDWQEARPRTAVKQDLLYTLGGATSIFSPSRNKAVARLEHLMAHGVDPGATEVSHGKATTSWSAGAAAEGDAAVDEPESVPDINEVAADEIATKIGEEFAGHDLAHLVAVVLEAEGFEVIESPPGADGGVDILAGRGLLGLESPKIVVQVKTGQVGSEVISQLNGLVASQGADYGLIATWSGLSKPARDAVKHQRFKMKVWESADIIEAVQKNYERLPEDVRLRLPLRRVWVLDR